MKYVALLCLLVLTACGASPAAAPQAIEPTALAAPTTVSLSAVNLEPLLIQPGDLPAGMVGDQVKDTLPPIYKNVPPSAQSLNQRFQLDGKVAGGVVVILYDRSDDLRKAVDVIVAGYGKSKKPIDGLGEQATITSNDLSGHPYADLVFVRCHAVVDVNLGGTQAPPDEVATTYARRLDKRLAAVVC